MWRELVFFNKEIERGIRKTLMSGLVRIDPGTGLIDLSPQAYAMHYDGNWLFFGHNTALRDCFTWHRLWFNCFNDFVCDFCKLRCYKVVIKTRNFIDAMRFRNAVLAVPHVLGGLTPIFGKVGIDERDYTDGSFNGFIYCDGLEDARAKYADVRRLLDEYVDDGKNIDAIIKRSCTEFEREHGPTSGKFWQSMTKAEWQKQRLLEDVYANLKTSSVQPDWLQNKVIAKMAKWGNTFGDKSWMEYFGCDDILTMKAVTYHEEVRKAKLKTVKSKKKHKPKSKGEK